MLIETIKNRISCFHPPQLDSNAVKAFLSEEVAAFEQIGDSLSETPAEKLIEKKAGQEAKRIGEGKKVLLAEDNKVHQLLTNYFLQKWGFSSCVASNGQEALRLAATQRFDLILMDLHMPEMDGYAASRKIRMLDLYYSNAPIIALTGGSSSQAGEEMCVAGFTDILLKPFKPEQLYNSIHKYLYTSQSGLVPNPLQEKLDQISSGDAAFKQQLVPLYIQSFREILGELNAGKLQDEGHLRHIRHKHKATFKMLGLDELEFVLLQLQEQLGSSSGISAKAGEQFVLIKAKINELGETVIRQLETIV